MEREISTSVCDLMPSAEKALITSRGIPVTSCDRPAPDLQVQPSITSCDTPASGLIPLADKGKVTPGDIPVLEGQASISSCDIAESGLLSSAEKPPVTLCDTSVTPCDIPEMEGKTSATSHTEHVAINFGELKRNRELSVLAGVAADESQGNLDIGTQEADGESYEGETGENLKPGALVPHSAGTSDVKNPYVDIPIRDGAAKGLSENVGSHEVMQHSRLSDKEGGHQDLPFLDRHDVKTLPDEPPSLMVSSQILDQGVQDDHKIVEGTQNMPQLQPEKEQNDMDEFTESCPVIPEVSERSQDIPNILETAHVISTKIHNRGPGTEGVADYRDKQDQVTFIEKQDSELTTGAPCKLVNVFITWTDSGTGEQTVLKWSHQNCNECSNRLDDWKHHALEKHEIDEAKQDHRGTKGISSTTTEKRSRIVIKTEIPDIDIESSMLRSRLTVSIPQLVNLNPLSGKTPKRGRKSPRKGIKRKKKSAPEVKTPDPEPDMKMEEDDGDSDDADPLDSVPDVNLPNKRKRGRPRKVVEEPDDPDLPEDSDSDYKPPGQCRQRKLRPKKKISYQSKNQGKIYICSRGGCNMTFNKLKECKAHEREAHIDDLKCKFEGCGMIFNTSFQKTKHEVEKHKGVFECEHCEFTFTSQKERLLHVKTHVSFKCEYENCGKTYSTEKYLQAHQRIHYSPKSQICPVCTKAFISKRYLNRHMKIHKERTHPCDHCPKSFKTREALEKHRRRHTGVGLLVCQFCGKKLNGRVSLERHERVHKGEKPYECRFCDKKFVCAGSLQSHEQEHTGLQWICEKCGHKFKTKGNLQEHERIHTGEKPCKCTICGKSYAAGSSLWKHVTSRHSGFKRYKCDVCGKTFARYNGLSKHKTVHTGIRNYECKYCHKKFTTSSIRLGHYKQVHLGMKRTGHQGRAKKLRDEQRRLAAAAAAKQEEGDQKLFIDESKNSEQIKGTSGSGIEQAGVSQGSRSSKPSLIIPSQEQGPGRRVPGMHPALIPLDFSRERRPGMLPPHQPPGDPSRSDFYTMVDSLIQFSKEH